MGSLRTGFVSFICSCASFSFFLYFCVCVFNPSTPKSDQFQVSPVPSPYIFFWLSPDRGTEWRRSWRSSSVARLRPKGNGRDGPAGVRQLRSGGGLWTAEEPLCGCEGQNGHHAVREDISWRQGTVKDREQQLNPFTPMLKKYILPPFWRENV